MNTKRDQSYQERFKRMKENIEKNKKHLEDEFPEDITYIGNPDLIKKPKDDNDMDEGCDNDEKD